jgi:hypothetical protein
MKFHLLCGLIIFFASLAPAQAQLAVTRVLGDCGDPCVVRHNTGGRVVQFEDAADAIRNGARKKLVIDGYCASSCMTLADRARSRTCITSRATFGYHKTNRNRPIPLRADLHRWIMANGGYPEFRAKPGLMPNHVARRFWRQCSNEAVTAFNGLPTLLSKLPLAGQHLN